MTFIPKNPENMRTTEQLEFSTNSSSEIIGSAERVDRYPVDVCEDEQDAVHALVQHIGGRRVGLITDDTVARLHGQRLAKQLGAAGIRVQTTSFPAGEANKSVATAIGLLDWLAATELARRDIILAVGGGVVIDTVGWVASAYMRGVPYCNVPTTLLAQVDASLGGKVAVDHPSAKNLIGSFHQPMAVVSNVGYLTSLGKREMRAGLAEAIKKGVISSPALFELIEQEHAAILAAEPATTARLVRGASLIKTRLISRDPYEVELRRPLNFGHTIGHAVETVTGYGPVLHGEAVAFGMACAARIAEQRGLLAPATRERLAGLLHRVGLPVSLDELRATVVPDAVVSALAQIRKIRDGHLYFVLPVDLGETLITDDVSDEEIGAALAAPSPPVTYHTVTGDGVARV
ncbi:3-dehydroquinate synthase [Streptomyces asiaticus]